MRRRDFLSVIASATAWPPAARAAAGEAGNRIVSGKLARGASACRIPADLAEAGYVEGKNLAIEYRFANFRPELMPEFAGDLVRLNMKVIFAASPQVVAAVSNATTSIPF
jgi:putative tryptophan/tyrosine transport system substrate-binding protein